MEKEKGKMFYVIDGKEMDNLDANHIEGKREVIDSVYEKACVYHEPLKRKKVNIGSKAKRKEATIGDYWSEKEVSKIIKLLCEFEDLFPLGYHELKGVQKSLGEMKIKMKEGSFLIWKSPYRVNLNIRIKVKKEIEKIITSRIIEAMKESEWVIPMVIKIKKDEKIRICVDYKDLNALCVIDPFPTPFTE